MASPTRGGFLEVVIPTILRFQRSTVVTPGAFPNGPQVYFQCPLLPVK
jgi:hypothetical protein